MANVVRLHRVLRAPPERVYRVFLDPAMPGEMQVTISLTEVTCGTELSITQEGIPPAIPLEFCYLGWPESLSLLAHLVEPEIPDGA